MVFGPVSWWVQMDVEAADLVDGERDQLVRIVTIVPVTG
jgi:hypothetical protein